MVDHEGKPVPGVNIMVWSQSGGGNQNVATDADGVFRLDKLPSGALNMNVALWRPGASNFNERFEASSAADLPKKIVIPQSGKIEIAVRVAGKRELPKTVNYTLQRQEGNNWGWGGMGNNSVTLDDDGKGVIEGVQSGAYSLKLTNADFPPTEPIELEITEGQSVAVSFVLDGTATGVTIRVEDTEGDPVARATVALSTPNRNNFMPNRGWPGMGGGLTTDDTGTVVTYELATAEQATTVTVNANGYAATVIEDAQSQIANGEIRVVLEAESALLVTVYDAEGELANGITVTAQRDGENNNGMMGGGFGGGFVSSGGVVQGFGGRANSQQTSDGFARLSGLSAGEYKVTMRRSGELVGEIETVLGVGEEQELEYTIPPGMKVTGVVTFNGVPASEGNVTFRRQQSRKSAALNSSGRYEIELASEGEYSVSYSVQRSNHPGGTHNISQAMTLNLEFESATFSGLVLDPEGEPVSGATGNLSGIDPPGSGWHSFTTDGDGRFTLDNLAPGKYSWTVNTAIENAFASAVTVDVDGATEATFQYEAGRTLDLTFVGTFVPDNVWVNHVAEDGTTNFIRPSSGTPSEGLRLAWPEGGTRGYVQSQNSARAYFTVAEGVDAVEVRLEPGGTLVVSVRDTDGGAANNQTVRIEPVGSGSVPEEMANITTSNGGSAFVSLVPGTYRVSTTLPDGSELQETAEVAEGQNAQIVLAPPTEE